MDCVWTFNIKEEPDQHLQQYGQNFNNIVLIFQTITIVSFRETILKMHVMIDKGLKSGKTSKQVNKHKQMKILQNKQLQQ